MLVKDQQYPKQPQTRNTCPEPQSIYEVLEMEKGNWEVENGEEEEKKKK